MKIGIVSDFEAYHIETKQEAVALQFLMILVLYAHHDVLLWFACHSLFVVQDCHLYEMCIQTSWIFQVVTYIRRSIRNISSQSSKLSEHTKVDIQTSKLT